MAAGWQAAEHDVEAVPPLKLIVPGFPWHSWQKPRSDFALVPWNAAPPMRGSSHVVPVMCGVAALLWHIVPLKQPGAVPAAAGVGGRCGLFGFPEAASAWHPKHTGAFAAFTFTCVLSVPPLRHGLFGCGDRVWQEKQSTPPCGVRKSLPWQIWHANMLEAPGARFAEAPCCCVAEPEATQPVTVPWWQAAVLLRHDTREIPPDRSSA